MMQDDKTRLTSRDAGFMAMFPFYFRDNVCRGFSGQTLAGGWAPLHRETRRAPLPVKSGVQLVQCQIILRADYQYRDFSAHGTFSRKVFPAHESPRPGFMNVHGKATGRRHQPQSDDQNKFLAVPLSNPGRRPTGHKAGPMR